jgi:hypothetical protein
MFCVMRRGEVLRYAIAYPIFVQVASTLNNFIRTRTRAADVTDLPSLINDLIANLIASWDLPDSEKIQELATTKILFAGWSWKLQRFQIGVFDYGENGFEFSTKTLRLAHPWYENVESLVFVGDYEAEYTDTLRAFLAKRHGPEIREQRRYFDFDYEPVQALHAVLRQAHAFSLPLIGGAPQLLKLYSHSNCIPIVVRTTSDAHFLLGRRLFAWEKTEYPVIDLSGYHPPSFIYPMSNISLPSQLEKPPEADPDTIDPDFP